MSVFRTSAYLYEIESSDIPKHYYNIFLPSNKHKVYTVASVLAGPEEVQHIFR